MPSNKGYIVDGVWYMGRRPPTDEDITVMFEPQSRTLIRVHEIRKRSHKVIDIDRVSGRKTVRVFPRK